MKHIACMMVFVLAAVFGASGQSVAVFDWSNPAGLNPAFGAPDSDNRYGEYVGGTVFVGDGATFEVDDSEVSQQSRRARFLFSYTTRSVELRAYLDSYVVVRGDEGRSIGSIVLEGPEVDEYYISLIEPSQGVEYTASSDYTRGTWTLPEGCDLARFRVNVRMECSQARVFTEALGGVDDITADAGATATWYTLQGIRLPQRPAAPGLYIRKPASGTPEVVTVATPR